MDVQQESSTLRSTTKMEDPPEGLWYECYKYQQHPVWQQCQMLHKQGPEQVGQRDVITSIRVEYDCIWEEKEVDQLDCAELPNAS